MTENITDPDICSECMMRDTCPPNSKICEYPLRPWYSPSLWAMRFGRFIPLPDKLKQERKLRIKEKDLWE